ncbi:SDR family NAD(P)-dependent oxidoreductase [Belliella kenyensis]|uniref:SDR family NAD(P)-dependent oxidoreductase n=1 Tax=Belliella kenyensis TaxID=1472724 RepID=A0ABV8EJM0_9BACT|nr:glucose 1-dehydrogenase [Belliella kenyensis]MCH7403756.1 glucose 1-dehydrogenase [Belliella kenyensis]MDN3604440.1 glucose 1-dehydrogenase [Belliella kenyensis]
MDLSNVFSLEGKVALVTGASKGIGLSIATVFAAAGAKVIISSRKQEALDKVASTLKMKGYEIQGIACNVSKIETLDTLVKKVVKKYGGIDILVNNAASISAFEPVHKTSGEDFDKIMGVNVKAPFELMKLCFPHLRKSSYPTVINISAVGGLSPEQGHGVYSISKSALISLSKVFAKEWGEYNIRVNVICPGVIKTKFSEPMWGNDKIMKSVMSALVLKRIGQPEEVATLALFLASSAASYTTGAVITTDGGLSI